MDNGREKTTIKVKPLESPKRIPIELPQRKEEPIPVENWPVKEPVKVPQDVS